MIFSILRFAFLLWMANVSAAASENLRLHRDGPLARDYMRKLEWMRCSVGQTWQNETCLGEVVALSVAEAKEFAQRMSHLDGGGWRLPTLKELKTIVSKIENRPEDVEPNIDVQTFPNTFPGPYWSSDQSFYSKKYHWSVNFYTGHSFNRFFPSQKLAVRLVRDYQIQ